MHPKLELFLPIHGHVRLYREEVAVIDHPAFQRLRRVRQLGLAHMIFPGGTHTRLEHSIGAVHVAELIIQHVRSAFNDSREGDGADWHIVDISEPAARFIRLGALLHDIGHVPVGHTLEDELNHLQSHDGPARFNGVTQIRYPNHEVDAATLAGRSKPSGGWNLKDLINTLYDQFARDLGGSHSAFTWIMHRPRAAVAADAVRLVSCVTTYQAIS